MSLQSRARAIEIAASAHDDALTVVWTGSRGPKVTPPTGVGGYGSELVERSLAGQLKGSILYNWAPAGVVATLRMSPDRLAAYRWRQRTSDVVAHALGGLAR